MKKGLTECAQNNKERQKQNKAEVQWHPRLADRARYKSAIPFSGIVALGSRQRHNNPLRRVEMEREVTIGHITANIRCVCHIKNGFEQLEFYRQLISHLFQINTLVEV